MPKKFKLYSVINMIKEYEGMNFDPNLGSNVEKIIKTIF